MFPPTLLCGAVLLNVTLRKCVLSFHSKAASPDPKPKSSSTNLDKSKGAEADLDQSKQLDVSLGGRGS